MEKIYNPKDIEERLYNSWEKSGCFQPNNNLNKKSFCIMMPPPNITGNLHMGHAFQQTIMDILIRYHRMQGDNTLWQVGTDHAGIATQILVERQIYSKEKKTKKDYTRNKFIEKIWLWKKKSHDIVTKQMRRLGNSVDWDREKFTLDPDICKSVQEAFIILYQDKLIYRRKRLVHWDSILETVISDLEVDHRLTPGKKWFIRYPIIKNKQFLSNEIKYLIVATTRPETILGDVALAVNPKDSKYNQFIGQFVMCPIVNRIIPIIGDEHADLKKDTGCVKITPAHNFDDYKVGLRHKLPIINILNFNGTIKQQLEIYDYKGRESDIYSFFIPDYLKNLDVLIARKKIVSEVEKLGFLEKVQKCDILIPYSERSGAIIEPILTNQWYLKTYDLAKLAINAVKEKKIQFFPSQYESMYFSWMNNIEDWCISRQLWWGHRIPVWYDNKNNEVYVGRNEKEIRQKYNVQNDIKLVQDNDVLDTWFSSSLWTFSTLGWPKKTDYLKVFHPTNVLISGFDIIFFWIARMIMLTMYFIKDSQGNPQVPFKCVYITGLIRDEQGNKMSKSKGNVIDPIDMIDGISLDKLIQKRTKNLLQPHFLNKIQERTIKQFPNGIEGAGTDALRFTFAALASNTRDIQWDMNRLKGYRNFCNKLWNASRFVLINTKNHCFSNFTIDNKMLFVNKWILIECNKTIKLYRNALDTYRFDIAANLLYDFTWNIFCDWYLEFSKLIFKFYSEKDIYCTKNILIYVLELLLRLSHPIIPFISEFIWKRLKDINNEKTIMLQSFPKYNNKIFDEEVLLNMDWIKKIIIFLRNTRNKMNFSRTKLLPLLFVNIHPKKEKIILENIFFLKKIAFLDKIEILSKNYNKSLLSIKKIIDGSEVIIPISEIKDKKIDLERLIKEISKIKSQIFSLKEKVLNQKFLKFAPKNIIFREQERLTNLKKTYLKLCEQKKYFHKDFKKEK